MKLNNKKQLEKNKQKHKHINNQFRGNDIQFTSFYNRLQNDPTIKIQILIYKVSYIFFPLFKSYFNKTVIYNAS